MKAIALQSWTNALRDFILIVEVKWGVKLGWLQWYLDILSKVIVN